VYYKDHKQLNPVLSGYINKLFQYLLTWFENEYKNIHNYYGNIVTKLYLGKQKVLLGMVHVMGLFVSNAVGIVLVCIFYDV
jgi:hypothetical protein